MAFYYSTPIIQYFLTKENKQEFHIKLRDNLFRTQAYLDNTGMDLWANIHEFIESRWDMITDIGTDSDKHDDVYIWIHLPMDPEKKSIVQIIESLNVYFEREIRCHLVPKLMTIIAKHIQNSERFFAESICEYQDKFGKDRTKQCLNVYFKDIKSNLLYFKY